VPTQASLRFTVATLCMRWLQVRCTGCSLLHTLAGFVDAESNVSRPGAGMALRSPPIELITVQL
jgi:hypothetical protein